MIKIQESSSRFFGWWTGVGPYSGTAYEIDGYYQDNGTTHWFWAAKNRDKLLPDENTRRLSYDELWPKIQAKWVRAVYDKKSREAYLQVDSTDKLYYDAVIDFLLHLSESHRINTVFVDDFDGNEVWERMSLEDALASKRF